MKDVQETLDRLTPASARTPNWDTVMRQARSHRRGGLLQLAVATGVVALGALFVVAPWNGSERVGVLDRALGAVGDQPITHAVFRGEWGGTRIDLKTGERKPLYGEDEIWYDASRNLAHQISRFGGAVESEELYTPDKSASPFAVLARDYRKALADGTARVVGKGAFDGVPVYWITIRRLMLPDVSDNRDHELAEEVAVSTESFKPVAIRASRDQHAFSTERVVSLETVNTDQADFSADPDASLGGRPTMSGSHPIPIDQAATSPECRSDRLRRPFRELEAAKSSISSRANERNGFAAVSEIGQRILVRTRPARSHNAEERSGRSSPRPTVQCTLAFPSSTAGLETIRVRSRRRMTTQRWASPTCSSLRLAIRS
jgi:hypothetical protein